MGRRRAHRLAPLGVALVFALAVTVPALAREGNGLGAAACRRGGWTSLVTTRGVRFPSQAACISYARRGGVLKRVQTVSFTSAKPASATVGSTYMPAASATSGLPVTITIDPASAGVCSLSGAVVTFHAVGTCTINANQAGDGTYFRAAQAQQSILVTSPSPLLLPPLDLGFLRAQTVAFTSTNPSPVTVGATYTPAASATSGLPVVLTIDAVSGGLCSIANGVVTFLAAGTCTIDADQPGNPIVDAAPRVQQSVVATKAAQTVSFTSTSPTSGAIGGTYTPAASATSGLPVVITVDAVSSGRCSIANGVVTLLAAGTCTLDANQAGNAAFDPAPQVQQSFAVVTLSQALCQASGGTFSTASAPWHCDGIPTLDQSTLDPFLAPCLADGGFGVGGVPPAVTGNGGWNVLCFGSVLEVVLFAASAAINGALVAALTP